MAAASCGRVQPQGPSLPRQDDFVGQVRGLLVQPLAQHRKDSQAAAYVSNGIRGECHHRRLRD
jgi:hypothetical protein